MKFSTKILIMGCFFALQTQAMERVSATETLDDIEAAVPTPSVPSLPLDAIERLESIDDIPDSPKIPDVVTDRMIQYAHDYLVTQQKDHKQIDSARHFLKKRIESQNSERRRVFYCFSEIVATARRQSSRTGSHLRALTPAAPTTSKPSTTSATPPAPPTPAAVGIEDDITAALQKLQTLANKLGMSNVEQEVAGTVVGALSDQATNAKWWNKIFAGSNGITGTVCALIAGLITHYAFGASPTVSIPYIGNCTITG